MSPAPERFSTQYGDLLNQLKIEFTQIQLGPHEESLVKYMQIPWFPGGQYALHLIKNKTQNTYKLIEKSWDYKFDTARFSYNIYNLDRLCIKTRLVQIIDKTTCETLLNNLAVLPETVESVGYILLDGVEYELTLNLNHTHKQYNWKVPNQEFKHLQPLVDYLHNIAK